jgi:hypothetical protein
MKPHNSTSISDKTSNSGRAFWLQSTLESYEVEELTGWQLASILSELPRMSGAVDFAQGEGNETA